jgi:hypothetical protein
MLLLMSTLDVKFYFYGDNLIFDYFTSLLIGKLVFKISIK